MGPGVTGFWGPFASVAMREEAGTCGWVGREESTEGEGAPYGSAGGYRGDACLRAKGSCVAVALLGEVPRPPRHLHLPALVGWKAGHERQQFGSSLHVCCSQCPLRRLVIPVPNPGPVGLRAELEQGGRTRVRAA